mmetsp:Transcript_47164/g.147994  ORF Transcript_47164/g.147994 Transcript_47164/m.147994 type:complete len:226 (-) Transcript_47164:269-946(-)
MCAPHLQTGPVPAVVISCKVAVVPADGGVQELARLQDLLLEDAKANKASYNFASVQKVSVLRTDKFELQLHLEREQMRLEDMNQTLVDFWEETRCIMEQLQHEKDEVAEERDKLQKDLQTSQRLLAAATAGNDELLGDRASSREEVSTLEDRFSRAQARNQLEATALGAEVNAIGGQLQLAQACMEAAAMRAGVPAAGGVDDPARPTDPACELRGVRVGEPAVGS